MTRWQLRKQNEKVRAPFGNPGVFLFVDPCFGCHLLSPFRNDRLLGAFEIVEHFLSDLQRRQREAANQASFIAQQVARGQTFSDESKTLWIGIELESRNRQFDVIVLRSLVAQLVCQLRPAHLGIRHRNHCCGCV